MPYRSHTLLGGMAVFSILTCSISSGQSAEPDAFTPAQRNHWAFRSVIRAAVPAVSSSTVSLETPIDALIVEQLQRGGADLSAPADRRTVLRRVTFDLIGLPPTPEEAEQFLTDDSPDAFEKVVDRLLSHPHFGEAWGRNWLDVVRFAETSGFNADPIRPAAFTYRDYVIRAFNRDLPFDRFIADQLAGDELFPDDAESQAATGYCRMWPDESNASNVRLARQTSLDDLTANVGAAFLGLSIGCAQCHDHKFDPLLQTDFYQLQAFFSGIVLEDKVAVGTDTQLSEYRRREQAWRADTARLRQELNQLELPARVKLQGDRRMKFPAEILEALDLPIEDRTTMQRQLAFWSARQMTVKEEDIPKQLDDAAKARREELLLLMADAKLRRPVPNQEVTVMAVAELTPEPPVTQRMENGSYDKPKEVMVPHVPTILRNETTQISPPISPPNERSSGRRSALARWLSSGDNPLTQRVWVNRIWQGHFGQGLVSNANDFGTQTPPSTHPELLDWLTSDFIDRGFHSKRLHRLIVLSATYRQRSDTKPTESASDDSTAAETTSPLPYSYFPRQRLSSERIRDAWLMASGQLNDAMYGPGTRPELPPHFSSEDWKLSEPSQRTRRSIYIFAKRNLPYPLMAAFDFPDMHEACGCRTKTTIAPQALMLLNSRLILQAAQQLAARATHEATSADPAEQIQRAWQITFGRPATASEVQTALKFLDHQYQLITTTTPPPPTAASPAPAESTTPQNATAAALTDLCHALLNTNEFLFLE